jgi:hypothetical protein
MTERLHIRADLASADADFAHLCPAKMQITAECHVAIPMIP